MAINKVLFGEEVLVDLSNDTVSPENLQAGAIAHSRSGNLIRGTAGYGGSAPCTVLLAPSFDAGTSYTRGDHVIYNGGLYQFIWDHPAGSWNSNHARQVTMSDGLSKGIRTPTGDLNDFQPSSVPYILYTTAAENYPNAPEMHGEGQVGLLYVYEDPYTNFIFQYYFPYNKGGVYSRFRRANGQWDPWKTDVNDTHLDNGTDINDVDKSGMYVLNGGTTYEYQNLPSSIGGYSKAGYLQVYKDIVSGLILQTYFHNATSFIYTRFYTYSSGWSEWKPISSSLNPAHHIRNLEDVNDLTDSGIWTSLTGIANIPNFPAESSVGVFLVTKEPSADVIHQIFIESYTGKVFTRIRRPNGSWDPWASQNFNLGSTKTISILFIGNSLTQDGIAYLPYLLKTYYPEIDFRFYMWYNGEKNLAQQYEYFTQDTPCDIFSVCENSISWTNYNSSMKMSDILDTYTFDVVCMQEYFNYKNSYTTSDLVDWTNCRDYIVSNYTGDNSLEFISLFHAPRRNALESVYALTKSGNELILEKTITQDMIPVGIAIYNAMQTELSELGDGGDLTPGDHTHTQEGLPCLIQTYTACAWLLDKLGVAKSVYGCPLRMTSDIYNSISVPGPNIGSGVITGTDAQNLLAQEVAVQAFKQGKYIVQNNIYVSPSQ